MPTGWLIGCPYSSHGLPPYLPLFSDTSPYEYVFGLFLFLFFFFPFFIFPTYEYLTTNIWIMQIVISHLFTRTPHSHTLTQLHTYTCENENCAYVGIWLLKIHRHTSNHLNENTRLGYTHTYTLTNANICDASCGLTPRFDNLKMQHLFIRCCVFFSLFCWFVWCWGYNVRNAGLFVVIIEFKTRSFVVCPASLCVCWMDINNSCCPKVDNVSEH